MALDGTLITIWPSIKEAHRHGYGMGNVWACCNKKKGFKTYKGYIWEYV